MNLVWQLDVLVGTDRWSNPIVSLPNETLHTMTVKVDARDRFHPKIFKINVDVAFANDHNQAPLLKCLFDF